MPSIINAATSGGLISTADTSGVLQLQTASTTAMTINGSQNVGIGTASPATKVEISGTVAANNLALRITNTATDGYSTIQMGDGSSGIYRNGSAQSAYGGASSLNLINVGAHPIGLATGNTIRAIIPAAGGVQAVTCVSVGNATPASTGAGITFPATQSASSDANTLDDYEEGTWTPSVGGTAEMFSYGTYVKIGKMVTVSFDLIINSIGTGSTTTITNFPFASSDNNLPRTGCVSYYAGLSISPIFIAPYLSNNNVTCVFVWNTTTSSTIGFNSSALFQTGSRIIGSVTYSAAS